MFKGRPFTPPMWSTTTPDVSARVLLARLETDATKLGSGLSQSLFDRLAPEIAALKAAIKSAREAVGRETKQ
jgi:hypothetical protein